MCFNYRSNQIFTEQKKQRIRTFSAFAATAINNIGNVSIIKNQRKQLEARTLEIEFEYEMIYNKMLNMLPVANAASLAEIVRAINHDIRNHLGKINRNLNRIRRDFSEAKNTKENKTQLENIIKTVENDINNSTNLIALFEPNSFRVSNEDFYEILEKVEMQFKRDMLGINLEISKSENEIPLIRCSKAEIAMIIYNLFSNAKNAIIDKFKKEGKLNEGANGFIKATVDFEDNTYILQVEDNGIGIDNKLLEKIFEPGFTTREEGIGIGLFFVKETVTNNYSGSIICESTYNRGTTFTVNLKQHNK
jgi:signal transduction histidine kinase